MNVSEYNMVQCVCMVVYSVQCICMSQWTGGVGPSMGVIEVGIKSLGARSPVGRIHGEEGRNWGVKEKGSKQGGETRHTNGGNRE